MSTLDVVSMLSLLPVATWLGLSIGAKRWRVMPRPAVFRFSTGQEVSSLFLFEWLAVTPLDNWPPGQEILEAARSVGANLSLPEVDRLITAVRPMAERAIQRGEQALTLSRD